MMLIKLICVLSLIPFVAHAQKDRSHTFTFTKVTSVFGGGTCSPGGGCTSFTSSEGYSEKYDELDLIIRKRVVTFPTEVSPSCVELLGNASRSALPVTVTGKGTLTLTLGIYHYNLTAISCR